MAAFAELEREMIRERLRAGFQSYHEAYAKGLVGFGRSSKSGRNLPAGRQRRVFDHAKAMDLSAAGASIRAIAAELGIGKGTVERFLRAAAI
jgi:DNA invertase Pin-like site-specific DNA recombinase